MLIFLPAPARARIISPYFNLLLGSFIFRIYCRDQSFHIFFAEFFLLRLFKHCPSPQQIRRIDRSLTDILLVIKHHIHTFRILPYRILFNPSVLQKTPNLWKHLNKRTFTYDIDQFGINIFADLFFLIDDLSDKILKFRFFQASVQIQLPHCFHH